MGSDCISSWSLLIFLLRYLNIILCDNEVMVQWFVFICIWWMNVILLEMNQCNMAFDLKINLRHSDLYFTVQWLFFFYYFLHWKNILVSLAKLSSGELGCPATALILTFIKVWTQWVTSKVNVMPEEWFIAVILRWMSEKLRFNMLTIRNVFGNLKIFQTLQIHQYVCTEMWFSWLTIETWGWRLTPTMYL